MEIDYKLTTVGNNTAIVLMLNVPQRPRCTQGGTVRRCHGPSRAEALQDTSVLGEGMFTRGLWPLTSSFSSYLLSPGS